MARDFYHTGLAVGRSDIKTMLDGQGPGTHYYVDYRNGADTKDGLTWGNAFKTYSAAVAAVTSNNNDVIHIDGDSTVAETAMVTLSKNRVHTIGHNGVSRHMGNGAKIAIGVTTAVTDIACFKNTGVRNTFTGIKFISNNTLTEGIYAVAEDGEFATYINCEFYMSTQLGTTAAAELLCNGDTASYYDCTFGSTANATTGTAIRANVLCTAVLSAPVDTYFENCLFLSAAGHVNYTNVYAAAATDIVRMFMMKDCTFFNDPSSAATPADAVGAGAAQTIGAIILKNCTSVDHTVMAAASVTIYVDGAVPVFATSGVSLLTGP